MTDGLVERMRRAHAEDLIIMARGDGIAPEAVAAARAELIARDIPSDELDELAGDLNRREQEQHEAAVKPLPPAAFVFYLFLGMGLIGIVGIFALLATGRHRMASDAIRAIVTGVAITLGLGLFFVLCDMLF